MDRIAFKFVVWMQSIKLIRFLCDLQNGMGITEVQAISVLSVTEG